MATTKTPATKATAKSTPATTQVEVPSGPSKQEIRTMGNVAAGQAVAAFYAGKSLPFKSAEQRLSPVNPNNAKKPSARQAAAIAAAFVYGAGNISKTGIISDIRGFNVPAQLADKKAPKGHMMTAQLESGVLGNMLGNAILPHGDGYKFDIAAIRKDYLPKLDSTVRKAATAAINAITA